MSMFRPWVSLPTNPCPMLVAFQDSEIQLALDQLFPKPRPLTYRAQNQHLTLDKYCRKLDFMVEGSQLHADARAQMQTNADEHKANCIQCVGRHNLNTRPDIRRLLKTFRMHYTTVC